VQQAGKRRLESRCFHTAKRLPHIPVDWSEALGLAQILRPIQAEHVAKITKTMLEPNLSMV